MIYQHSAIVHYTLYFVLDTLFGCKNRVDFILYAIRIVYTYDNSSQYRSSCLYHPFPPPTHTHTHTHTQMASPQSVRPGRYSCTMAHWVFVILSGNGISGGNVGIYYIYIYLCVSVGVIRRCPPDRRNIINGYLSAVKGFLGNNRCSVCVRIYIYIYNVHILLDFILPASMLIEV